MEILMIAIYILGFVSILLFALVLFLIFKKEGKEIPKNTLTLEISETFRKTIEGLIGEEVRRNLLILRGEIEREQKKITDEYKRAFEELGKELRKQKKDVGIQTLNFSQKIKEMIGELRKITQETQGKILTETEKILVQTQNQFLEDVRKKTETLEKGLEGKFSEVLNKFREDLKKEMEKSKIEIENYKKEKIKEINKRFYSVLNEITKEVLRKTIDLTTHERLVMTALEKAKEKLSF